jgi:putative tricarboxylic transport membrane protein
MGPIVESNLNLALTIHEGDLSVVMSRPITLIILALALVTAVYGFLRAGSSKAEEESG